MEYYKIYVLYEYLELLLIEKDLVLNKFLQKENQLFFVYILDEFCNFGFLLIFLI